MDIFATAIGFFHWVGASHYLNLLLVGLTVRSGLEILSAHPKLYRRDHCTPGTGNSPKRASRPGGCV
jgi:sulfoxide reductase catalytic subunit YedY